MSPLAARLGFVPLPPRLLLALGALTAAYLGAAQVVKSWFYRRFARAA